MVLEISCGCGAEFTPTREQMAFIKRAKSKGMTLIMLECPNCPSHVAYNPQTGKPPRAHREAVYRCPVSHCTGNVSHVDHDDDEEPFWGCGECGSIWYDKDNLLKEIDAIVKRFAYRRKCYRKVHGKWAPAERAREPSHYEEMVEQEPWDETDDFVRG